MGLTEGNRKETIRKLLLISWILLVAFLNLYHFPDDCDIGSNGKDKLGHLVINGMGMVICYLNSFSLLKSFFFVFCYGVSLEITQYFLPYRSFELLDLIFNLLGTILGTIFIKLVPIKD